MSRKGLLDNLFTGVLAACAVAITLMLARREFMPAPDPRQASLPIEVKDWRTYGAGAKRIGIEGAPVTIVEFSDFQCPFCRHFSQVLDRARAKYPGKISLVYRNFPLQDIHPFARSAATAAECAAFQGRFPEYHNFLFQHQDSLAQIAWTDVAERVGVQDTSQFRRCLTSSGVAAALKADSLAGNALHVTGTPTIVINRWLVTGAPPEDVLDKLITQELHTAHRN